MSSESKNYLATFKDLQKPSPLLRQANYKFLAGSPPQEKSEYRGGSGQTRRRSDKVFQQEKGGWVKKEHELASGEESRVV